jgi:hypothetical protein
MAKKNQLIMIWLLPLIVIGGLFYPTLCYLLVAMMAFFLPFSFLEAATGVGIYAPEELF